MNCIFLAGKVCKLVPSKTFTHLIKTHVKQFSKQNSFFTGKLKFSNQFTKKKFKNYFILSGLLGASCYGLKSIDLDDLKNLFCSFLSNFVAHCKDDSAKNYRTKHYEKSMGKSKDENCEEKANSENDQFDWTQFFKLLFKQKSYFILAVCVSSFYIFLNKLFIFYSCHLECIYCCNY